MDSDDALKYLGTAVRRRRVQLGLSQEELGEASDMHRNYIGGVERAERNLGFENFVALARGLQWTIVQLADATLQVWEEERGSER